MSSTVPDLVSGSSKLINAVATLESDEDSRVRKQTLKWSRMHNYSTVLYKYVIKSTVP